MPSWSLVVRRPCASSTDRSTRPSRCIDLARALRAPFPRIAGSASTLLLAGGPAHARAPARRSRGSGGGAKAVWKRRRSPAGEPRSDELRAVALMNLGVAELWSSQVDDARATSSRRWPWHVGPGRPWILEIACLGHLAIAGSLDRAVLRGRPRLSEEAVHVAEAHDWGDDRCLGSRPGNRGDGAAVARPLRRGRAVARAGAAARSTGRRARAPS